MACSPVLFLLTVLLALMAMTGGADNTPSYIKYTTITGFFLQDDPSTQASSFDYVRIPHAL